MDERFCSASFPHCLPFIVVYFTLQFRDGRHHPGRSQRSAVTKGQHAASRALHWPNNDPGKNTRASDHSETNFHKVKKRPVEITHLVNCGSEITCWSKLLRFRRGRSSKPIFVQIAKQVVSLNPLELRLPSRAWKVKLVGEGADDAGGVFDDTITEMCQVGRSSMQQGQRIMEQVMLSNILSVLLMYFIIYNIQSYYQELQSGVVDLLIHTPNGFADVGSNTDRCSFYGHLIIKQYPCNITSNFLKMAFTFNIGSAARKVPTESSGILRGSHDPVSVPGHPHGCGYPHQKTSGFASGSLGLETALFHSTGRR